MRRRYCLSILGLVAAVTATTLRAVPAVGQAREDDRRNAGQGVEPRPSPVHVPPPHASRALYTARLTDDALAEGHATLQVRSVHPEPTLWQWPDTNLAVRGPVWATEGEEDEQADRSPARLGQSEAGSTAVWIPPGVRTLEFDWSARGRQGPVGGLVLDLRLPPAAATLLVIDAPKQWQLLASVGVVEGPTEIPGEPDWRRWQITLGGHHAVVLQLSPEEAVPETEPLVLSRQNLAYEVTESGVLLLATITPEVLRQPIHGITLWIDPRLRITEVSYPDTERLLEWTVEEADDGGRLHIQLPEPVFGVTRSIRLRGVSSLERGRPWTLPGLRPITTFWQEGTATIRVRSPLVVERLEVEAGRQVNVRPVADALPAGEDIMLQFFEPAGTATLVVNRAEARLDARIATQLAWSPQHAIMDCVISWSSRSGEAFELECRIPAGWRVVEVAAQPSGAVRQWRVAADGRRLVVQPARPVSPQSPLRVEVRVVREPASTAGEQTRADAPWRQPLPLIEPLAVGTLRGLLSIHSAPYEIRIEGTTLEPLDAESRQQWLPLLRADEFLTDAFMYEGAVFAVLEAVPARAAFDAHLASALTVEPEGWTEELRIDVRPSRPSRPANQRSVRDREAVAGAGDRRIEALVVYFPPLERRDDGFLESGPSTSVSWRPSSIEAVRLPETFHAFWELPPGGELWQLRLPPGGSEDSRFLVRGRRECRAVGATPVDYVAPVLPGADQLTGTVEVEVSEEAAGHVALEPDGLVEVAFGSDDRTRAMYALEGPYGRLGLRFDEEDSGAGDREPVAGAGTPASHRATQNVRVLQGHIDAVFNVSGMQRYTAAYTVHGGAGSALSVSLPDGAELIEVSADGELCRVTRSGSDVGRDHPSFPSSGLETSSSLGTNSTTSTLDSPLYLIPLSRAGLHEVRIEYQVQGRPLELYADARLAVPRIGAVTGPVEVRIWLPAAYTLLATPEGWRAVDPAGQTPAARRFPDAWIGRIAGPLARRHGEPFNPFQIRDWQHLAGRPYVASGLRLLDETEAILTQTLAEAPDSSLGELLRAYHEREESPMLIVDAVALAEQRLTPSATAPTSNEARNVRQWLHDLGLTLVASPSRVVLTSTSQRARFGTALELHGGRFLVTDPLLLEWIESASAGFRSLTDRLQTIPVWLATAEGGASGGSRAPGGTWGHRSFRSRSASGTDPEPAATAAGDQTVLGATARGRSLAGRVVRLVGAGEVAQGARATTIALFRSSTLPWLSATAFVAGLALGLCLLPAQGRRWRTGATRQFAVLRAVRPLRLAWFGCFAAAWSAAIAVPVVLAPVFSLLGWGLLASAALRRLGRSFHRNATSGSAPSTIVTGPRRSSSTGLPRSAPTEPRERPSTADRPQHQRSGPQPWRPPLLGLVLLVALATHSSAGAQEQGDEQREPETETTAISTLFPSPLAPYSLLPHPHFLFPQHEAQPAYLLYGGTFSAALDTGATVPRVNMQAEWDVLLSGEAATLILPFDERAALLVGGCRLDGTVYRPLPVNGGIAIEVRGSGEHRLTVEFAPRIVNEAGTYSSAFAVPPLPTNRLIFDAPRELNVRAPGGRGSVRRSALPTDNAAPPLTRLEADLGPVREVRIEWSAQQPVAGPGPAIDVETHLLWDVHPASLSLSALLRYEPGGRDVQQLSLLLDPGLRFRRVRSGPELDVYESLTRSGEQQLLVLELDEPQSGPFEIRLEFVATAASGVGNFRVPRLEPHGVRRRDGLIAVRVSDELEAQLIGDIVPTMAEASRFADAWPDPLENLPQFVYPVSAPETLTLSTRPRSPHKTASEVLQLRAEQQRLHLTIDAEITTSVAPSFQHRFYVGPGFQVQSVSVTEADIDRLARWSADDTGNLTVFLTAPTAATQQVRITGRYLLGPPREVTLHRVGLAEGDLADARLLLVEGPYARIEITGSGGLEPEPRDDTATAERGRTTAAFVILSRDYHLSVRVAPHDAAIDGNPAAPAEANVPPLRAGAEPSSPEVLLADVTVVLNDAEEPSQQPAVTARGWSLLGRARFYVLHPGSDLRFSLPAGAQITGLEVDGRPLAWQTDDGLRIVAPLGPSRLPRWIDLTWHQTMPARAAGTRASAVREIEAPQLAAFPSPTVLWTVYPPAEASLEPPPDLLPRGGDSRPRYRVASPSLRLAELWELDLERLDCVVRLLSRVAEDGHLAATNGRAVSAFTADWLARSWLPEADRLRRRLRLQLQSSGTGTQADPRALATLDALDARLDAAVEQWVESGGSRVQGNTLDPEATVLGRSRATVLPPAAVAAGGSTLDLPGGDLWERPGMGRALRFIALGPSSQDVTGDPDRAETPAAGALEPTVPATISVRVASWRSQELWWRIGGIVAVILLCGAAAFAFRRNRSAWRVLAALLAAGAWWYWLQPSWLAPLVFWLIGFVPTRTSGRAPGQASDDAPRDASPGAPASFPGHASDSARSQPA